MKSLLSLSVIVPSKSVKKINFGFLKGQFMAFNSDVCDIATSADFRIQFVMFWPRDLISLCSDVKDYS